MRRADRLFDIIQMLRRAKLVRARDLAEQLEVSERTIYRDISDLVAGGVPIEGEAGVGYVLRKGFDLPPLMFDEQEIEALVLGARILESWADPQLAEAAANVIAKVEAVMPARLQHVMEHTALIAPANHFAEPVSIDAAALRAAVRDRRKVRFHYSKKTVENSSAGSADPSAANSTRTVWPLGVAFYGPVWLLAAWCELRGDFRSFRLDRMNELAVLEESYGREPGRTLRDYLVRDEA